MSDPEPSLEQDTEQEEVTLDIQNSRLGQDSRFAASSEEPA